MMNLASRKILIVDDQASIAKALKKAFENLSIEAKIFLSGEEALAYKDKGRFPIIISDLKLPGISGLELCRQLKKENSHLTCLLMSAYFTQENLIDAFDIGVKKVFPKPFNSEEVLNWVIQFFNDSTSFFNGSEAKQASPLSWRGVESFGNNYRLVQYYKNRPEWFMEEHRMPSGDCVRLLVFGIQSEFQKGLLLGIFHHVFNQSFEGEDSFINSVQGCQSISMPISMVLLREKAFSTRIEWLGRGDLFLHIVGEGVKESLSLNGRGGHSFNESEWFIFSKSETLDVKENILELFKHGNGHLFLMDEPFLMELQNALMSSFCLFTMFKRDGEKKSPLLMKSKLKDIHSKTEQYFQLIDRFCTLMGLSSLKKIQCLSSVGQIISVSDESDEVELKLEVLSESKYIFELKVHGVEKAKELTQSAELISFPSLEELVAPWVDDFNTSHFDNGMKYRVEGRA